MASQMLGKYELIEDKYNNILIQENGNIDVAWSKTLSEWELYSYKDNIDSPQDSLLLNTRAVNEQFMFKMIDKTLISNIELIGEII